jgi:hypothetical protein
LRGGQLRIVGSVLIAFAKWIGVCAAVLILVTVALVALASFPDPTAGSCGGG